MPPLPVELIEEIFLRLPPDEPELLVRASLASKLWLGRLTAPQFHARYSDFHRAPPMLGFFYTARLFVSEVPLFISTTKFVACVLDPQNRGRYSASDAWDCRHGRLLLGRSPEKLIVLDPMTGCRTELDLPGDYCYRGGATVLCPVSGCDHRTCHDGPSQVIFVGLDADFVAYAYMSLPETGEWSKPSSFHLERYASIQPKPPVLIQDALYFLLEYDVDDHVGILKYDLCSKCLSLIDAMPVERNTGHITILMGMKDGSLGFAITDGLTLILWSMQIGLDGVVSWTGRRVIDLKELLPDPETKIRLIGSVEGADIIFVSTRLGVYKINIKSLEWKKIWKRQHILTLVPYMSFYYPQERVIEPM